MLRQNLASQFFIASALSALRLLPTSFFHLQYVVAGYVEAGYTVL